MKLQILDTTGKKKGERQLPSVFSEDLRRDLIERAVMAVFSTARQPYGSFPEAGKRASVPVSKRRRNFRGCYGKGIARTPRKVLTKRGSQFYWVGAFAPNTRKGRRAHPPKAEKIREERINKSERRKAIRSAIAATLNKSVVSLRGHIPGENYPFLISSDFESLKKTKEVKESLLKLGLDKELDRCSVKKVRAGRGKMRNRKHRRKVGPLFVVSSTCSLCKSARNIPGVEVVNVKSLNAAYLAPGLNPGRLTLWTEEALDVLEKEKLFN